MYEDERLDDDEISGLSDADLDAVIQDWLRFEWPGDEAFALHPAWDATAWDPVELKLEELDYFYGMMEANANYAKLFLFSLSAFLASARAVTLYLQKHAAAVSEQHRAAYEYVRAKYLSDDVARFFLQLRNEIAHEGYPRLAVDIYREDLVLDDKPRWTEGHPAREANSRDGLTSLQSFIDRRWDTRSPSDLGKTYWGEWLFGTDDDSDDMSVFGMCAEYRAALHTTVRAMKLQMLVELPDLVPEGFDLRLLEERARRRAAEGA